MCSRARVTQLLSSRATTTEVRVPGAHTLQQETPHNEKPTRHNERAAPLTIRESLHAAMRPSAAKSSKWEKNTSTGRRPKNLQNINAGEGVEKREPSYSVGENVNWYSHCREQYGGSSEN